MAVIMCHSVDRSWLDLTCYSLHRAGFDVRRASTSREITHLLLNHPPDLCVLDLGDIGDGAAILLNWLRSFTKAPIIALCADAPDDEVIALLDSGADMYINRLASVPVVVSHIRAVLRRLELGHTYQSYSGLTYGLGQTVFDVQERAVIWRDRRVTLTDVEGRILHMLLLHVGEVLSNERIFERLWGYDSESDIDVVKAHMWKLRRKLKELHDGSPRIDTVAGRGYLLRLPESDHAASESGQAHHGSAHERPALLREAR